MIEGFLLVVEFFALITLLRALVKLSKFANSEDLGMFTYTDAITKVDEGKPNSKGKPHA